MKEISQAAQRKPSSEELKDAYEILALLSEVRGEARKARLIAYFLREAEETGAKRERDKSDLQ